MSKQEEDLRYLKERRAQNDLLSKVREAAYEYIEVVGGVRPDIYAKCSRVSSNAEVPLRLSEVSIKFQFLSEKDS